MASMKTTLELPEDLFREAKATAARTGTTLKALVIEALREKLHAKERASSGQFVLPELRRREGPPVTSELVAKLESELGP